MALAESGVDSTEAVVHGVISDANAKMVVKYLEANKKSISRIIFWYLLLIWSFYGQCEGEVKKFSSSFFEPIQKNDDDF